MSAITLESVSRRFGATAAVDGIDLAVETGEFLTLLGPSGCGKTTTLRMIAGLERNTEGRISIGGELVSDAKRQLFVAPERRRLGMVFQSYAIWPHMTVFENVAYPLKIKRLKRAEISRRVLAALELVEMAAFAERPAPALSGGQQQRVAIARALVSEPRVLLLDEPLSNLDARLRTQMGDEFRALQKRLQITTVYVTHDQIEAMSLSDRVVVMGAGRILQIGAPRDIYLHPNTTEVARFFGSPNILEGTVRSCRPVCGSHYETEIAGRGWQGVCRAGEPLAAGTSIHMIARPESLMLQTDTSPRDDAVQLAGVVRELIFRGTHCTVVFETEAGLLNAQVPPITTPQIGEQVRFGIEPAATWAVRD